MNIKAIFIYTSAFLAPIVLLLLDRLVYPRKDGVFVGATWIGLSSILILLLTAWAYDNDKINDSTHWVHFSYWIYPLSLYFWMLAIADTKNDGRDYEAKATQDEDDFAAKAAQRRRSE